MTKLILKLCSLLPQYIQLLKAKVSKVSSLHKLLNGREHEHTVWNLGEKGGRGSAAKRPGNRWLWTGCVSQLSADKWSGGGGSLKDGTPIGLFGGTDMVTLYLGIGACGWIEGPGRMK
jgi:hypothetical protein